jgi:hypothetical protein
MWHAYDAVSTLRNRIYEHATLNHRLHFVDPNKPTVHTQTIEGLWSLAKKKLRNQHGTSKDPLPSYIVEFVWRHACASHDPFSVFITAVAEQYPV